MSKLLQPLAVGELELPNRVVMAPLTRNRASMPGRIPNALMRDYYKQRASAGMILTEATSVEPRGVGYPSTPGIWSRDQVEGWKGITTAVHEAGGRILLQLWHVGRISHSRYHDGALPVAPSAIAASGHVSMIRPQVAFETPRALETSEIPAIVEAFRRGAENAKAAGFDGVEIHGANGYLLDQFLQDGSNKRTDAYGGPVQNRARLHLEVTDAVLSVWAAGRVGMHLAPRADSHAMGDSTGSAPSAIWRASSASAVSPSSAPARRWAKTASGRSSSRPSAASTSPMSASTGKRPRRPSRPAKPMPSPSARRSSPTRICPSGSP